MSCDYNQRRFSVCALRNGLAKAASQTAFAAGAALKKAESRPASTVAALSAVAASLAGATSLYRSRRDIKAVNWDIDRFNALFNLAGVTIYQSMQELETDDFYRTGWQTQGMKGDQPRKATDLREQQATWRANSLLNDAAKAVGQLEALRDNQKFRTVRQVFTKRLDLARQALTTAQTAEGIRRLQRTLDFQGRGEDSAIKTAFEARVQLRRIFSGIESGAAPAVPSSADRALAASGAAAVGMAALAGGALFLRARLAKQKQKKQPASPQTDVVSVSQDVVKESFQVKQDLNDYINQRGLKSGRFVRLDTGEGNNIVLSQAETAWYADSRASLAELPETTPVTETEWAEQFEPERDAAGNYRLYETPPADIPRERLWALRLDENGSEYAVPGVPADGNALGYRVTRNEWHTATWKVLST